MSVPKAGPYMVSDANGISRYANTHDDALRIAREQIARGADSVAIWRNVCELEARVTRNVEITFQAAQP